MTSLSRDVAGWVGGRRQRRGVDLVTEAVSRCRGSPATQYDVASNVKYIWYVLQSLENHELGSRSVLVTREKYSHLWEILRVKSR